MSYNILFLDQFGTMGGGQRVLLDTLRALDSTEHQRAVALSGDGEFREKLLSIGTAVLDLPLGEYHSGNKTILDRSRFIIRTLYCSLLLIRAIRSRHFDLLYANGPRTFICATLAGWATRRAVIWHLHNVFQPGAELYLLIFFSRWVNRILVCSQAVSEPLLRRQPKLKSKVKLLYNPLPEWNRSAPANEVIALQKRFHLQAGFICFGILGRVTPFKGQITFIQAAQLVLQKSGSAYFFVIGSPTKGDHQDQAYYDSLRVWVRQAGLESAVFFVGHQSEIERYYALLDVVVMASQGEEASPQTVIEAMSLGKVVIAPNLGGIREMLEDGRTGLLMERAEPNELATKMLELIRNPGKRSSLGSRAQRKAIAQFSRKEFEEGIRLTVASCLRENDVVD
jgi:glycosyltransferase involved in cell wall biosynthesis